ncbi:TetR/AcrR family transcriptional regulator [Chitinibacter bivalviorum]|uniref:TetR/AcrR family transcriptional regulator n=1 Tax=Chitinibacter bivalviorum TaxID=2739434 RepID=A0A7H9BN61_9NEIS|nr:TetR/AcrR family transcriptional regulator [Chitinibacter bivalviorum]QLG88824.1 TetR/AcrR family transcriptional regulator [Chitinibacter bivalviorum]
MAIQRSTLIELLRAVFHTYGYDGASLSRISQATGLGKGSLYHHFPGGKDEMAIAVLQAEGVYFQSLLAPLSEAGTPLERLRRFAEQLQLNPPEQRFSSTLDVYTMGDAWQLFQADMRAAVEEWVVKLSAVLVEAGIAPDTAQYRAKEMIAQIEGMRLICRCLGDWKDYEQLLNHLPEQLLKPSN